MMEKQIALAIFETILEVKTGVPGGHLYAALMTKGINFETFNSIMSALKRTGLIECKNHCWFPSKKFLSVGS